MTADFDVLVDELYALPLERFVPERTVLVRQLRADGRRDDAARVQGLEKPSIVGWAVNQVVRAQRDATARLWEAGDAVLAVQGDVVEGRATGAELRASIEAERRALGPLGDAARGLVTGSGKFLGEQHALAVVETLHAAAIDPAARERVAGARLVRPLRLTGLEAAVAGGQTGATDKRRELVERDRKDDRASAERRRDEREARARRQAAQQALVRAEGDRDAARNRISDAARARDDAAAAAEQARLDLEAAEHALTRSEERLAGLHAELERAEEAVDRARADIEPA
jgi:DNA-binding TFAR19-related protein (PDSD5 family)